MKITHKKLVSATEPVECDALAPISKLVKKLSRSLWNNLKKLAGIDIEKSEEGKMEYSISELELRTEILS